MSLKAFLVDTTKCTGCRACQSACKQWNSLPFDSGNLPIAPELTSPSRLSPVTWTRVRFAAFEGGSDAGTWSIIHEKCNHCASPECLKICPERAIFKEDGWTIVDHDRCIGCGACERVCPYDAVHVLREKKGSMKNYKSYKCHGCLPTGSALPACSSVCPTGALTFDFRMRQIQKAEKRVSELKKTFPEACVYGLEPFGGLNVITILKSRSLAAGMEKKISRSDGDIFGSHLLYSCIRPMTLGFDQLKRKAWSLSSALSDRDKGISG